MQATSKDSDQTARSNIVHIKLENLFSSFNIMSNLYLHESNYGRIGSRLART